MEKFYVYVNFKGIIVYAMTKDSYFHKTDPELFRVELSRNELREFAKMFNLRLDPDLLKKTIDYYSIRN